MTTQIDIANRALLAVGARAQVSSINPSDGSDEGNALSVLWTPTFEALGRTANWNCLRRSVTLSLIAAAQGTPENVNGTSLPIPEFPWLYAYAYPSDCLKFNFILPSNPIGVAGTTPQTTISNSASPWIPSPGQIQFVVSTRLDGNDLPQTVIYTNQSQSVGVYNVNLPEPNYWDSLFQAGMVASLGAYLVPALSLNLSLLKLSIQTAREIITEARTADGNEGVTVMDHLPDWMLARAGASGFSGYNFFNNGSLVFGYQDMVWPSFNE